MATKYKVTKTLKNGVKKTTTYSEGEFAFITFLKLFFLLPLIAIVAPIEFAINAVIRCFLVGRLVIIKVVVVFLKVLIFALEVLTFPFKLIGKIFKKH